MPVQKSLETYNLYFIPYPGLYNKTYIQSVYNTIRKKLEPG